MKFYGGVRGLKMNKWLDFGCDPNHLADCPIRNLAITQPIMSGFQWHFQDNSVMIQGTIDWFFNGDLDHQADTPNLESGQYRGN